MTDPSNSENSSEDGDTDSETPGMRRFVIFACLIAFGLFVISLKMLYSGWVVAEDPNGLIVVLGDPSTEDAVITVTTAGDTLKTPLTAKLSDGHDHRLRFHLPPGRYTLDIALNGIHQDPPEVVDVHPSAATLVTLAPRPSTPPATRGLTHSIAAP